MKKTWIAVIAAVVVVGGIGVSSYNSLVTTHETVEQSFSDIDSMLQRRADLIPNLVNTVKGYAAHESEVITEVADARAKLAGATTTAEKAEADGELSSAISRLLAVVENYPELKADTQFTALTDELAGTENRIAKAREDYNEKVKDYNTSIKRFPRVIFAGMLGFEKADYFEANESANKVPSVEF